VKSRVKILVVSYGGGHAAAVAPVVAALRSESQCDVVALGLTTAKMVYERLGVSCSGYADYLPEAPDDAQVLALGGQLLSDVAGTTSPVSAEESRAYLGSCMADLIAAHGETEAWRLYRQRGRHAFDPERTIRRIVQQVQPDLVVTTNSPKSERAAIRAARALGIESVMIPDMFCQPSWELYMPLEADHFAVLSSLAVRNLAEFHGVDPSRVSITGQPAFDKQHVPDRATALAYVRDQIGTAMTDGYLLITTSPDVPDATWPARGSRDAELAVRGLLARSADDTLLVIKPHPSESREAWAELVAGHDRVVVAPAGSDINLMLRAADGLVAASPTTAVIDAFSLDVPTVVCSVGRPAMRDVLPWVDLEVPIEKTSAPLALLGQRAGFLARVPAAQEPIRREFHRLNVGAAARVADLLRERATRARQRRA
jgi:hypothetical protein